MVCDRCKTAVRNALEKQGLEVLSVSLGEAELTTSPATLRRKEMKRRGYHSIKYDPYSALGITLFNNYVNPDPRTDVSLHPQRHLL